MRTIAILADAVRQVRDRPRAVLYLITLPALVWIVFSVSPVLLIDGADRDRVPLSPSGTVAALAAALFALTLFVSMAAGWHRHVLADQPARLWAAGRGPAMLRLVGTGLLILLILTPPVLLAAVALFSVGEVLSERTESHVPLILLVLALNVLATAVALRLTTALPGAALGRPRALSAAWRATNGQWAVFVTLAAAAVLFQQVWPAVLGRIAGLSLPVALVMQAVLVPVSVLATLAVQTTLWGHFVEGRPLR